MARIVGINFVFQETPLRMCFTLEHRGIVGIGRQLPLSSRKDKRLESCFSSVLSCCLSSQLPLTLSQEQGKSFGYFICLCVIFLRTCCWHLRTNTESTGCPQAQQCRLPREQWLHFSLLSSISQLQQSRERGGLRPLQEGWESWHHPKSHLGSQE